MTKPKKTRQKQIADRLWSIAVRGDWNNQCAVCGNADPQAHHLIPRQHYATRYDLWNGIALCANHHLWDKLISPHQNAAGWMEWLRVNYPERHEWYNVFPVRTFDGTANSLFYCGHIRRLQEYVDAEQFVAVVGVKFAAWLEENA